MATTIVYAGTADDTAGGGHATYASVVATYVTADGKLWTGQLLDTGTYYIDQAFLAFDTSSIADTDVVSAAVLDLWGNTNLSTTDFTVEVAAYDWSTTVTTADFRSAAQLSALTVLATYDTSGFSTGAYKTFTSTGSFPAAINLTGETRLIVFSAENRTGSAPANYEEVVWTSADAAGTTNDPKLTVTHAAPAPSGTGAPSVPAATVAGTGTVRFTATGAVTVPAPTAAGTGTQTLTATGAVTVPAPTAAGTGTQTLTATGAVTVPAPTAAGTGTQTFTATGAVTGQAPTVAGTGTVTMTATGAITGAAPTVSGTGAETFTSTGAVSVPAPTVSGTGTHTDGTSGSGSVTGQAPTVTGTGTLTITGTGATSAPAATTSGTGTEQFTATGAIAGQAPTAVGAGTLTIIATGAITVAAATVSTSGTLTITGTTTVGHGRAPRIVQATQNASRATDVGDRAPRITQADDRPTRIVDAG